MGHTIVKPLFNAVKLLHKKLHSFGKITHSYCRVFKIKFKFCLLVYLIVYIYLVCLLNILNYIISLF